MKNLELFPARDNGLVMVNKDQVVTTSLRVAEYFCKDHKSVLRQINSLDCSDLFRQHNFALSCYTRKNGNIAKSYPMYYLSRDGFTFLAMGFTGKVAAKFKEAYINAFNEMEEMINSSRETEYAERLFKKQVEEFNKDIQKAIKAGKKKHGIFYGGAGDMVPRIPYYEGMSFESNLRNAFAFVNNSYLESMYFISQMFKKEKELESIKRIISKFTNEIVNKTGIY